MPEPTYKEGESFEVQFVWRSPDGDFLRALFNAEVQKADPLSEKYIVRLNRFLAGRQESTEGQGRSPDELSRQYWAMIDGLTGRRISLAYEVDDGRPLWLRWETLTGEHNFFYRLDEVPKRLAREGKIGSPETKKAVAKDLSGTDSPDRNSP